MRFTCAVLLLLGIAWGSSAHGQTVSVSISQPAAGGLVADRFDVIATAGGPNEITSATASVGSVSLPLTFSSGAWRGVFDASSLPRGFLTFTVVARDGLGNSGSASESIRHDRPPLLQVTAPVANSVARPSITISATCNDDDPAGCASMTATVDGAVLLSGTSSLAGQVNLSAYDGQSKTMVITATDSAGQTVGRSIPLFVESSTLLTPVAQVPGTVLDIDATRVLYWNGIDSLMVRSRADGTDTVVAVLPSFWADPVGGVHRDAGLVEGGVVYQINEQPFGVCGFHLSHIYPMQQAQAWEGGSAVEIGCLGDMGFGLSRPSAFGGYASPSIQRAGRYSLAANVRRDSVAHTSTDVASLAAGRVAVNVSADGAMLLNNQSSGGAELRRADGSIVQVSTKALRLGSTDGTSALFPSLVDPIGWDLTLWRAGTATQLHGFANLSWPALDENQQLVNGHVAYIVNGPSNVPQLHRMLATESSPQQITFSSTASKLDRVGNDGSVLFFTGARRYLLAPASTTPRDVASGLGLGLYAGGVFYLAIGNTAFALAPGGLVLSRTAIDFGVSSMGTSSLPQSVAIRNVGTAPVSLGFALSDPQFTQTNNCASVPVDGSCTVTFVFTPNVASVPLNASTPASATVTISGGADGVPTLSLTGQAQKSLAPHYYAGILNRLPDPAGKQFWDSEVLRMSGLGADINEVWYVMARYFFGSAEYASLAKDDTDFVTDLYETFFNRGADSAGLQFWTGQIRSGLPREIVLLSFMFSPEFRAFNAAIFGDTAARPEVNVVMDLFRGVLNRLPDSSSFNFWVGSMRAAQCQGAAAVRAEVDRASNFFIYSDEYIARNRTNRQFVTDMYDAFLRRGGDLSGVDFWVNQLNAGASRESVRQAFVASQEFSSRVQAVVAAGCLS